MNDRAKRESVRRHARAVRAKVAETLALLDANDLDRAYAAAEEAQHLAFDMKARIAEIGKRWAA